MNTVRNANISASNANKTKGSFPWPWIVAVLVVAVAAAYYLAQKKPVEMYTPPTTLMNQMRKRYYKVRLNRVFKYRCPTSKTGYGTDCVWYVRFNMLYTKDSTRWYIDNWLPLPKLELSGTDIVGVGNGYLPCSASFDRAKKTGFALAKWMSQQYPTVNSSTYYTDTYDPVADVKCP